MAKDVTEAKSPRPKPVAPPGGAVPVSPKAAPKKSGARFGLWIGLILVLLIAAATAWYFFAPQGQTAAVAAVVVSEALICRRSPSG